MSLRSLTTKLRSSLLNWLQRKAWEREDAQLLKNPEFLESLEQMRRGEGRRIR
jgi:hypothetical protein